MPSPLSHDASIRLLRTLLAAAPLATQACAPTAVCSPASTPAATSPLLPPASATNAASPAASTVAPPTTKPVEASCSLPAGTSIPDTPAGRVLTAWLGAFDSANRACLEAYAQRYEPDADVGGLAMFRQQTGGFTLVSIDKSEPSRLAFRVRESGGTTEAVGRVILKSGEPPMVAALRLHAVPPGAKILDVPLDKTARTAILAAAVRKLREWYVFPDMAEKMIARVREREVQGAYDAVTDGEELSVTVASDLRGVSHDKHLDFYWSPTALPPDDPEGDSGGASAEDQKQLRSVNCGFEKVERLASNIGYLKFNMFGDAAVCRDTASAAMNFLADTDAIIFDLRDNGGGDPDMVSHVVSYLFAKRTHINDLYTTKTKHTHEYWTRPNVPGKKSTRQPLFVLTSNETFSAAEEFSYDLQAQKRATIVGETTKGGAHPVRMWRINDSFGIAVPYARAVNPILKTDWEGVGVVPDVKAAAAEALSVAVKLATAQPHERR